MAANGTVRGLFGWVLDPGTVVQGRYQVTAVLGKGGFGVTYLVDDLRLAGKRRALKEIPALLFDEYETRVLGRLNHPAVPDIIDRFDADGMVYLVLEYGGNRTLRSEMDRQGGRIPVFLLLPWIEQVCAALVYLHSQCPPIIHRDLKPENILLDDNERVMLIDFGVAKETDALNVTRTIGRAVTHGFSPPEQVLGTGTDTRSDVYALGAILYCAITGRVPPAAHERITGTVLEPPSRFFPEIPPLLDAAICQAMELNLHQRHQSIAELAQCLALVRSRESSARTVVATDGAVLMKGLRATATVQLAGVEFPSLRQSPQPATTPSGSPQPRLPQPPSAGRPRVRVWIATGLTSILLICCAGWIYWQSSDRTVAGTSPISAVAPHVTAPKPPAAPVTTVPPTEPAPAVPTTGSPPITAANPANPTANTPQIPNRPAAVPQVQDAAPVHTVTPEPPENNEAVARSERLSAPADERTEQALALRPAQRRQIQAWLASLGLDPGPVDGEFGAATRGALRSWQRASELPDSGFLDKGQLQSLGQDANSTQAQRIYWEAIQWAGSVAVLADFVALYPNGQYTNLARSRIAALRELEQRARIQAEQQARRQAEQQTRPAPTPPARPPTGHAEPKQPPGRPADAAQHKPEPPRRAPSESGSHYTPEQLRAIKRFNDM
jgi:serine/threonine-protein kinase